MRVLAAALALNMEMEYEMEAVRYVLRTLSSLNVMLVCEIVPLSFQRYMNLFQTIHECCLKWIIMQNRDIPSLPLHAKITLLTKPTPSYDLLNE